MINTKHTAVAVELSSERLGTEVAETLAQVLFSRLKLAILQRASIPPASRVPLTVIVDEYSLIRSPVVPILYRLVRNMNVTVIVMLQDMSVFSDEELRAILGSTGTILAMGCGEKEAERLCLELYRPSGTKRKSWKDERYYSPNEEMYIFYDLLSKEKQKPRQAICLVNPKGLYFLKTQERTEPVADPVREAQFKEAVAAFWWAKPAQCSSLMALRVCAYFFLLARCNACMFSASTGTAAARLSRKIVRFFVVRVTVQCASTRR